ncbi:MAG: cytochrome c biogenesis protein ResB [Proteobacteria bacterium]|nr:cytochrome c biogenesis protein ResB [Desulfobacula sp.]MBU4131129.1 cytochrome c biogenesis protein ResB [Pseudomonadota bacterium]
MISGRKNLKKKESIPNQIWMFFCSVELTVYTLVLLATTSIIGTVVLQNGSPQQYVTLYGNGFYNLIKVLKLDDMYHAWWFLFLLLLLCINIIVCSIERLSLTWKTIFPKKVGFNPDRFRTLKNKEIFTTNKEFKTLASEFQAILSKRVGPVLYEETSKGCVMYAEKGRWTRMGVYVVHASIILLVLGALIGAVFGFKGDLRLDEGAKADTLFTTKSRTSIQLPFAIQCNEFEVRFYDTGAPEEFRSNLTIIENGKESFTQDIRVNHPLRYKGINIFQSSYGTAAPDNALFEILDNTTQKSITIRLKVGEKAQLPRDAGIFEFEGFLPNFKFREHNLGEAFFGKVTLKGKEGFQIPLPTKFPTFDKMRKGQFTFVVKDFEQRYYTGLQVTKDPGIWYVYAGFILMILGCWITFFISHQCYFIEIEKTDQKTTSVLVSGKANRNSYGMTLKIKKFVTLLKDK